jgi:hypothetical protein
LAKIAYRLERSSINRLPLLPSNSLHWLAGGEMVAKNNIRISKRSVDALSPGERPYKTFDDAIKGFGVSPVARARAARGWRVGVGRCMEAQIG